MSTSDTPRPTPETDAAKVWHDCTTKLCGFYVDVELARKLERERDEAREENASLHCLLQEAKRGADLANAELKELWAENAALRADKARHNEAIFDAVEALVVAADLFIRVSHGDEELTHGQAESACFQCRSATTRLRACWHDNKPQSTES